GHKVIQGTVFSNHSKTSAELFFVFEFSVCLSTSSLPTNAFFINILCCSATALGDVLQDVHNVPQNKDTLLARNISTLTTTLASLRSLHAYQLRIHPTNFKLFNHCILNGCHMGENFNPVAHAAIDNFLSAFSAVLAEKFR
uniref:Hemoglobin alpha embryonic-4 n=1 Tax=Cyprinus carpio carpio TaxID=630221 RepID=A0A9J7YU24_CYPCA